MRSDLFRVTGRRWRTWGGTRGCDPSTQGARDLRGHGACAIGLAQQQPGGGLVDWICDWWNVPAKLAACLRCRARFAKIPDDYPTFKDECQALCLYTCPHRQGLTAYDAGRLAACGINLWTSPCP